MGNNHTTSVSQHEKKKWPIILGVIAGIMVVSGIAFWNWHNQPSFCNAICHSPMDSYVEGYYHDTSLLAYTHQKAHVTCLGCHPAELEQQLTEAKSWVTGDFHVTEDGMLQQNGLAFSSKDCLKSGCHDFDLIQAATDNWGGKEGVNPHYSHQFYGGSQINPVENASENAFAMDCSWCHSSHGQSVMYCNTCHDFTVPSGWVSPEK